MRRWFVIAAVVAAGTSGCGTFESAAITDIRLHNDTSRHVAVEDCSTSSCSHFRYSKSLAPHANVHALDYGDGTSWWIVTSRNRRVGCLSLGIANRVEGYVLKVSTLRRCPSFG